MGMGRRGFFVKQVSSNKHQACIKIRKGRKMVFKVPIFHLYAEDDEHRWNTLNTMTSSKFVDSEVCVVSIGKDVFSQQLAGKGVKSRAFQIETNVHFI